MKRHTYIIPRYNRQAKITGVVLYIVVSVIVTVGTLICVSHFTK